MPPGVAVCGGPVPPMPPSDEGTRQRAIGPRRAYGPRIGDSQTSRATSVYARLNDTSPPFHVKQEDQSHFDTASWQTRRCPLGRVFWFPGMPSFHMKHRPARCTGNRQQHGGPAHLPRPAPSTTGLREPGSTRPARRAQIPVGTTSTAPERLAIAFNAASRIRLDRHSAMDADATRTPSSRTT